MERFVVVPTWQLNRFKTVGQLLVGAQSTFRVRGAGAYLSLKSAMQRGGKLKLTPLQDGLRSLVSMVSIKAGHRDQTIEL